MVKLSVMKYLYVSLFIIFTGLHLFASLKKERLLRGATKGLILMSVLGFYLESAAQPSWFLVVALLMSLLGDMLLIPNGTKFFAIGGIAFLISHIFFIIEYSTTFSFVNVPLYFSIPIAAVFAAVVVVLFIKLKPSLPKALFFPMAAYLLINGAMNCFAIYRLIAGPNIGSIVTAIGALLFFVSDSSLFFVRFDKNSKLKTHFLVMLTYSVAEFLIVLGLVL